MRRLSVLLAMLLAGCASFGKKSAEGPHNAAMGENGCNTHDKKFLEIAKLTQKFERIFRKIHQKIEEDEAEGLADSDDDGQETEHDEAEKPSDSDEDSYSRYAQWTDENGVLYVEISGESAEGYYFYNAQIAPNGTKIILYSNVDNNTHIRIEEKPGKQVLLRTYLFDTDGDRVFDERISNTFDFEKRENHCVVEKIIWKTTLEKTETRKTPFPPEMKNVPGDKASFGQTVGGCKYYTW